MIYGGVGRTQLPHGWTPSWAQPWHPHLPTSPATAPMPAPCLVVETTCSKARKGNALSYLIFVFLPKLLKQIE